MGATGSKPGVGRAGRRRRRLRAGRTYESGGVKRWWPRSWHGHFKRREKGRDGPLLRNCTRRTGPAHGAGPLFTLIVVMAIPISAHWGYDRPTLEASGQPRFPKDEKSGLAIIVPVLHNSASAAGWSSLAARRAHNPKVAGSNPAPATKFESLLIGQRLGSWIVKVHVPAFAPILRDRVFLRKGPIGPLVFSAAGNMTPAAG